MRVYFFKALFTNLFCSRVTHKKKLCIKGPFWLFNRNLLLKDFCGRVYFCRATNKIYSFVLNHSILHNHSSNYHCSLRLSHCKNCLILSILVYFSYQGKYYVQKLLKQKLSRVTKILFWYRIKKIGVTSPYFMMF